MAVDEMSQSWYCEMCRERIQRAEVHENLAGGYYHMNRHNISHPVHPGQGPTLGEHEATKVTFEPPAMNNTVVEKISQAGEFIENVDQLLTELLIFAASLTPKELREMSTSTFNALQRVMKVADRVDATSAGRRKVTSPREDLIRERRDGQEPNRPPVLRRGRDANPALRNNDGEKTGFLGMVERSELARDRNTREPNLYESEDAAGEPTVVDRDEERGTEIYRDGPNSIRAYPSSDDMLINRNAESGEYYVPNPDPTRIGHAVELPPRPADG